MAVRRRSEMPRRLPSRPPAYVALLAFVLGCAVTIGIHVERQRHRGPFDLPEGSALVASGGATSVWMGNQKPGVTDGYALPRLTNRSGRELRITGYRIGDLPAGASVAGWVVLDTTQTRGYLLDFTVGHRDDDEDVRHFTDHSGAPLVVLPRTTSTRYIVVLLRQTGPVHTLIQQCWVRYETGGRSYEQDLGCGIQLWQQH